MPQQTRQLAAIMPARRSFCEGGFTDLSAGSRICGRRYGLNNTSIANPIKNGK